jgi:hypothetical protein
VPYGNPFMVRDWHPALTVAPTGSRTVMVGALPVNLFTQLLQVLDASTNPSAAPLPSSLPLVTTLAGTPLVTDNLMVMLDPTMPATASFTFDAGSNSFYQLQIFQLVPNSANTALQFQTVMQLSGLQPQFTIPPKTFVVGNNYALRAVCVGDGYPNIANGDLTVRSLPFSLGLADSGAFTVMAPP